MSLKISRVLHAGYVFQTENTRIIFDPIFENPFSRNCFAYPDIEFDFDKIREQVFSAVFISHIHDDHCSLESLNLIKRETPIYIYTTQLEIIHLIQDLGFETVTSLKLDQTININDFEITSRKALDEEVDSIFQIKSQGFNVLNVVDSWVGYDTLEQLSKSNPWDLVLWPFQTMREIGVLSPYRADPAVKNLPEEWLDQIKQLNPRYIVPSSCQFIHEGWSWYNGFMFPITYKQFALDVQKASPRTQIIRLDPSQSICLSPSGLNSIEPLSWVKLKDSPHEIDYVLDEKLIPTSTAVIAQNFSPLTPKQTKLVEQYCLYDLIERYSKLNHDEQSYFFIKERTWKLSVYDHSGKERQFIYKINGYSIKIVKAFDPLNSISWTTEVPISRLYGAIVNGESLTSMYVRINEHRLSEDVESELSSVDILEDPLIRSLFQGQSCSYQKAQLKALQATCS